MERAWQCRAFLLSLKCRGEPFYSGRFRFCLHVFFAKFKLKPLPLRRLFYCLTNPLKFNRLPYVNVKNVVNIIFPQTFANM